MNKVLLLVFLCSLLVVACAKKEITSQQSIQDVMSKTLSYNTTQPPQPLNKTIGQLINETTQEKEITTENLTVNKKCRNAAIVYGGCKWTDIKQTSFTLKIQSASKLTIPGVWFVITGESGGVINIKKPGDIFSGGIRTYTVDYTLLVNDIGVIKRFEILPIEVMNGTEYACLNQRAYTVPEVYCKSSEPVSVE